jgi:hypothetical protein
MSSDLSNRVQNAVWWITSIATAVVCCSILFVLFASYFVDLRDDIRSNFVRLNLIEEREDKILAELESFRKRGFVGEAATPALVAPPIVAAPVEGVPISGGAPGQPAPANVVEPAPNSVNTPTPLPEEPAVASPAPVPAAAAPTSPPSVSVPVITSPPMAPAAEPDKK